MAGHKMGHEPPQGPCHHGPAQPPFRLARLSLGVFLIQRRMLGADFNMKADARGGFQWRQMSGAIFNMEMFEVDLDMEADVRAYFNMELDV
jgi:hypothetical protein